MIRFRTIALAISTVFALAAAASAWEGALSGFVRPIAEVKEKAEANDFVVVEGRVADVQIGDGSVMIIRFEDDSGELYLVVPNHLRRTFAGQKVTGGAGPTGADPEIGVTARVGGQWNQKPFGEGWGIQVQRVEPIGD